VVSLTEFRVDRPFFFVIRERKNGHDPVSWGRF
jgi:serine protease inhibitor